MLTAHAAEAQAWVCARVEDDYGDPAGPALAWPARSIPYAFGAGGTTHLDNGDAENTLRAAFAVWSQSMLRDDQPAGCSGALAANPNVSTTVVTASATDISFVEGPAADQLSVGYNYLDPNSNVNLLVFRDESWRYALTGPTIDIIALTTLTYNVITGAILDADIEFNTANYDFTIGDDDVQVDLLNTATHEVGHLLGFAHSLAPTATMYGSANHGETLKRTLSCDDAAILWYRYPQGEQTGSCPMKQTSQVCGMCAHSGGLSYNADLRVLNTNDGQGGCNCRSMGGDGRGWLAVVGATAAWRGRRRIGARGLHFP